MSSSEFDTSILPRVHVVDDDTAAQQSVALIARSLGLPVLTYGTASAFLDRDQPEHPGCLVLDHPLPDRSGADLAEQLAADPGFEMPVIVTSAHIDVPTVVRFMQAGAVTVLEKPCSANELSQLLAESSELAAERFERRARWRAVEARVAELTDDERTSLQLLVTGVPTKSVAQRLDVSERTIERRRSRIFEVLGVSSIVELTRLMTELESRRR